MLIHDFIHVELAVREVRARLTEGDEWLVPLAGRSADDGVRMAVGPAQTGLLTKEVRLDVGEPREHGDQVIVPIRWEATGWPQLFPLMDATLEIAPINAELTQITLWGSYRPPLEAVGRSLDKLVLHRLAEATVRAFLQRLGRALEERTFHDAFAQGARRQAGTD